MAGVFSARVDQADLLLISPFSRCQHTISPQERTKMDLWRRLWTFIELSGCAETILLKHSSDVTRTSFITSITCKLNEIWDSNCIRFRFREFLSESHVDFLQQKYSQKFWNRGGCYFQSRNLFLGYWYLHSAYNVGQLDGGCKDHAGFEWTRNSFYS